MRNKVVQRFSPEHHTPYIVACMAGVPQADETDRLVRYLWSQLPQKFKSELQYAYLKLTQQSQGFRCEARFLHSRQGILRFSEGGPTPESTVRSIFAKLAEKAPPAVNQNVPIFSSFSAFRRQPQSRGDSYAAQ